MNGYCELTEICHLECPRWWATILEESCAFEKGSWRCENCFLLLYSQCGTPASRLGSKCIAKYLNTNAISFPNTIANTLVRAIFKYNYKYFP